MVEPVYGLSEEGNFLPFANQESTPYMMRFPENQLYLNPLMNNFYWSH